MQTLPAMPTSGATSLSLATLLARGLQRIVTLGVLLVAAVSLVMITWLLLDRAETRLDHAGGQLRLQIAARLDGTTVGLAELSQRTLVRNALVDPSGRGAYIVPTLSEHRKNSTSLHAVWLTDHAGHALAESHADGAQADLPPSTRALAIRCVEAAQLQQHLHQVEGRWRLLLAYPVIFASTGTVEGALVGELDLSGLLREPLAALPAGLRAELQAEALRIVATAEPSGWEFSQSWPVLIRTGTHGASHAFVLSVHESSWAVLAPAAWIGISYLLMGALLLWGVRRRVASLTLDSVQPLQALRDHAHQITREGLEPSRPLPQRDWHRGGTEVQSLALSFQAMLERLLEAQTSLERTVADRTAELGQAKQRLDSTLANLADGVYSLSADRETLLFASPPVARLLGLQPDEVPMVRDTMDRLLDATQAAQLERAFAAAASHGTAIAILALPGDAHGPRWLENRMSLVRDAQGLPLRIDGILSDTTSAVRSRQARELAVAGLKLRDRALASTGNGVMVLALDASAVRTVYANPAIAQITGATLPALLEAAGDALQAHVLGDDLLPALQTCLAERRDVRLTTRVRRADGSAAWCDVAISPMADVRSTAAADLHGDVQREVQHFVVVLDDVTERRRQKEQHQRVIESVTEVIFQTDREGRWTYLNPAWERITGFRVEDSLGQRVVETLCPADRAAYLASFAAVLSGERADSHDQLRCRTLDGCVRWMAVRSRRIHDDDGQPCGVSGTLTDITEQRETEADLRLRNRAIDASSNGIVLTDVRAAGGPLVFVNDGFTRVTGYTAAESLGRNCGFLQNSDRDQPALDELRRAVAHGEPCRVVVRNYRKGGDRFYNDLAIAPVHDEVTGEVTHYIGIISDVTERLRAENLLRDQFARLDTLFALSPDGFVSFDGQGLVASVNPAFERLSGLPAAEFLGLDSAAFEARLDAVVEQHNPPGMAHWLADLEASGSPDNVTVEVLVLRGPPQRVVVCSRRDCDAPNVSRVLYLRDISRETEVDRMKSEFLSTAAHELRTPMASIRGFSDLLLMRKFDEARTRDVLQTINRQSVWLTNMINELLDLARIEARKGKDFQLEVSEVGELVRAGLGALMVPGDARVIEPQLPADLPRVRVDRAKFQHALTNVLSNAYKYSPEGGAIELEVLQRRHDGHAQVGVWVRDRGIGMSAEHCQRAFERFFRADSSGSIPGTGLGLALVKEIVELHGGQVQLESRLGEGTAVTLWLPAMAGEPVAQALSASPRA
jgi:PAS domain S-box-containing protein